MDGVTIECRQGRHEVDRRGYRGAPRVPLIRLGSRIFLPNIAEAAYIPLMNRYEHVRATILQHLRDLQATPAVAVSCYDIGIPLVPRGFTQGELADALIALDRDE